MEVGSFLHSFHGSSSGTHYMQLCEAVTKVDIVLNNNSPSYELKNEQMDG